jgi:hypothetical protein
MLLKFKSWLERYQKGFVLGCRVCGMSDLMELMVDVSNVAWEGVPQGQSPRYGNIVLCLEHYKTKLHKKLIASSTLLQEIDDKASFQKALDSGDVVLSPADRKVEDFILELAIESPAVKVVTNNTFSDYLAQAFKDGDLRLIGPLLKLERFIRFRIVSGCFMELPFEVDFQELNGEQDPESPIHV